MKDLDLILKNIKNKQPAPLYFFHGTEPYFIDAAIKALEHQVLEEDARAFGQTVVYGKDTTLEEVMVMAQQMPMFGDINMIIVKEAQELNFKAEGDEGKKNKRENAGLKALLAYLQAPLPTTVLAFGYKYKKLDGKTKLYKELDAKKFSAP